MKKEKEWTLNHFLVRLNPNRLDRLEGEEHVLQFIKLMAGNPEIRQEVNISVSILRTFWYLRKKTLSKKAYLCFPAQTGNCYENEIIAVSNQLLFKCSKKHACAQSEMVKCKGQMHISCNPNNLQDTPIHGSFWANKTKKDELEKSVEQHNFSFWKTLKVQHLIRGGSDSLKLFNPVPHPIHFLFLIVKGSIK